MTDHPSGTPVTVTAPPAWPPHSGGEAATPQAASHESAPDPAPEPLGPAVFATMLATEHWSLLGTRSTMWSEVMSRITIHLTISSASLVVLALFAQASGFGGEFRVMAIGLASAILVLGTLTAMRVFMASDEDAALITGMNRIRAAYVRLEPRIAQHLVTSSHDDERGLMATYTMGTPRNTFVHVVGSTSFFIAVVNSIVSGTLGALITSAAGGSAALVAVVGVLSGLAYLGAVLAVGAWMFSSHWRAARFPTPEENPASTSPATTSPASPPGAAQGPSPAAGKATPASPAGAGGGAQTLGRPSAR